VICDRCGKDNRPSARHCGNCGVLLGQSCATCGFENPPESSFCGGCGARLPEVSPEDSRGERRQLTVLFCDLVGATELSQQMDPEDLGALLSAYQRACGEAVAAHEGHIAQYLGDGVVVYFGYPRSHEDEAQRAVRCGLEIIERVRDIATDAATSEAVLNVRLGAHTGRVVVGPVGAGDRQSRLALGETPNIAARIQAEAPVGTLAISDTTWRIVNGYFTAKSLGGRTLKGVQNPIALWVVTSETASRERVEVSPSLTPFIGRNEERLALLDAWAQLRSGQSRFILLSGEPGMGKSRLTQWLGEEVRASASEILVMRATPYNSTSPFFPVIELLNKRFGTDPSLPDDARLKRLELALEERESLTKEAVVLLGALLSVPTESRYEPLELSAVRRRTRTMELLIDLTVRIASTGPTMLLVEDLHWADPTTLELLQRLVRRAPQAPLLGVFTARPHVQVDWTSSRRVRLVELEKFERADAEAVVRGVAAGKPLPSEVLRQILSRSEGVPLFLEELTRFVLDSGILEEKAAAWEAVSEIPVDAIPTSMDASLTARIDRLGSSRATAQLAGTIGREFSWSLLREVSDRDEETLERDLDRLLESRLVWPTGQDDVFSFKHALVRDAAYNSLLRSVRQSYHSRIAATILERFRMPRRCRFTKQPVVKHWSAPRF
jgi:class 3 adenylate cyclase